MKKRIAWNMLLSTLLESLNSFADSALISIFVLFKFNCLRI